MKYSGQVKSCGFCGGVDLCFRQEEGLGPMFIQCRKCGATGPYGNTNKAQEIVDKWNIRMICETKKIVINEP